MLYSCRHFGEETMVDRSHNSPGVLGRKDGAELENDGLKLLGLFSVSKEFWTPLMFIVSLPAMVLPLSI